MPLSESELLQQIQEGLSQATWQRFHDLKAKLEAQKLTPDEQQELIDLADQVEGWNVRRLEMAQQLAEYRGVPARQIIEELGLAATSSSPSGAPAPPFLLVGRPPAPRACAAHVMVSGWLDRAGCYESRRPPGRSPRPFHGFLMTGPRWQPGGPTAYNRGDWGRSVGVPAGNEVQP